jgi:PPOX class probable F420-dependent enzyme
MDVGLTENVRRFLDEQNVGVLATIRPNGEVRQSIVYHVLDGDRLLISTEATRAKARDVTRTGRASYCVMGHEKPYPSLTVEGRAAVRTEGIADGTSRVMAKIRGEAPDPAPTDEALAAVGRVLIEISVDRVYGLTWMTA